MPWFKSILFSLLIPGTVAGLLPLFIHTLFPVILLPAFLRWPGFFLLPAGLLFYLAAALSFLKDGRGTPAIWFSRKLAFLIGSEPGALVESGLYRFSRNPMYLGISLLLLGESLCLQNLSVLVYGLVVFAFFNLTVTQSEEPHLQKKFGEKYTDYCQKVPRWF